MNERRNYLISSEEFEYVMWHRLVKIARRNNLSAVEFIDKLEENENSKNEAFADFMPT